MARRNRRNGRFTKTSRRTSRKKAFSVGKAAETALVANAAIRGLFDTNIGTFITGKNIAGGFGDNARNNSNEVTLPELGNLLMGGSGGIYEGSFPGGLPQVIKSNIKRNGFDSLVSMVTIPLMFKVGRKVLAKPLINPTNRALKSIGLKEVKL